MTDNSIPELHGTLEYGVDGKKWCVLRTKPRCEKKLAKCAYMNNIEYYLPLVDSFREYTSKKVHFKKVLLSGYFFTKSNPYDNEVLTKTGYTASFIKVINQEELVDDLKRIYNIKDLKKFIQESKTVEEGYVVEIISGPLIGLTGIVETVENPERIILTVNVINKAVSVTLSKDKFKVIEKRGAKSYEL
jgi:transcription antitermination factor NusG